MSINHIVSAQTSQARLTGDRVLLKLLSLLGLLEEAPMASKGTSLPEQVFDLHQVAMQQEKLMAELAEAQSQAQEDGPNGIAVSGYRSGQWKFLLISCNVMFSSQAT